MYKKSGKNKTIKIQSLDKVTFIENQPNNE